MRKKRGPEEGEVEAAMGSLLEHCNYNTQAH